MPQNESKQPVTVWVANEAGHSYTKIRKKLGEHVRIERLSLGDINPLRLDRLSWHIGRGIARFVKEGDYLLISGTPIVNALALTMWLQMFPKCNLALWDAKRGEYKISSLERDNLANILQQHVEQ
ncbi:MAG: hypothetical protein AB7V18_19275 [Pyrinomonadaceae bacterium]